jgi:hypothetical protein
METIARNFVPDETSLHIIIYAYAPCHDNSWADFGSKSANPRGSGGVGGATNVTVELNSNFSENYTPR